MILEFNWLDHIFVLFIMVIIPGLSIRTKRLSEETNLELPPKIHLFYSNGLMLIIGAMVILTSWNISGKSWVALGMQWPVITFELLYPVILVIVIYLSDIIYGWLNKEYMEKKIRDMASLIPLTWKEYSHFVFLAFAAGISEEIIFRGFLINYLKHYLGGYEYALFIAISLPAFVFALSHLYQGWWAVLKIFGIALLFAWIFVQSGSLLIVIVIHILIDLISGMVGIGRKVGEDMSD